MPDFNSLQYLEVFENQQL